MNEKLNECDIPHYGKPKVNKRVGLCAGHHAPQSAEFLNDEITPEREIAA